jgi:hypothetical protein
MLTPNPDQHQRSKKGSQAGEKLFHLGHASTADRFGELRAQCLSTPGTNGWERRQVLRYHQHIADIKLTLTNEIYIVR